MTETNNNWVSEACDRANDLVTILSDNASEVAANAGKSGALAPGELRKLILDEAVGFIESELDELGLEADAA